MKLLEVVFQDTVNEPDSSTPQQRFKASDMAALDYDAGMVTATGQRGGVRLVPMANVRFMTPAPKEAKK